MVTTSAPMFTTAGPADSTTATTGERRGSSGGPTSTGRAWAAANPNAIRTSALTYKGRNTPPRESRAQAPGPEKRRFGSATGPFLRSATSAW